jgi:hypothetical protein
MVSFKRVLPVLVLTMAAVSLLLVVPTAFADSFSFSVSGSTQINLNSPNDNFWGDYETHVDGPGTTSEVGVGAPSVSGALALTNLSFFLPAGSTITSSSMEFILPTTAVEGTSVAFIASEHLPPPNPNDPTQIAPTFVNPGTATLNPFGFVNGRGGDNGIFDLTDEVPVVNGNEISTGDVSLEFTGASGSMEAIVATQGYNYAGYVDASGEVNIPYTLEVVGTYTVTPEPSGMVLLGTGMLALMGSAWYRRAATAEAPDYIRIT